MALTSSSISRRFEILGCSDMSDMNAERVCLALVNKLIVQCELPHPRIGKLSALSTQLVLMLFKACCGVEAPVVVENPRTREEEAFNVQAAIDVLSHRVLLMSLAHIDGRDVVACDPHVVMDLLEILAGCLEVRNCTSATSSTLSSPDSSLPVSTSEGEAQRNVCRCCGANDGITGRSTPIDDSDSPYSETSCFLCNYVAAKERSRRMVGGPQTSDPTRPSPILPPHQRIDSDTASCAASSAYETAESCLDEVDAKRFAHGSGNRRGLRTSPGQRRRQGSPYWLRGSPKPEDEPTESDSDVERLKATMAEIRQRLAAADKNAEAERPIRRRLRTVKKSVLLSPSLQAARRVSGGTPRKRLRSELDEPSAEGSSTDAADLSPHAERVLRRLHEQHVRFVVQASSSAADVATDADRLQRKHEELLQRHAQKLEALQKDLAHSRRLNDLETQRQLHLAIGALENDRRQQAAQLKRHHDERDRIMRSRRLSHRHKQQQMLQEAFKESVHARKSDLADIRASVRERQVRERDRHRVYLASLENFYQTQLSLLTESLAKEKSEIRQRAQAQSRVLERMRRDFKEQLEAETQKLYSLVAQKPHEGWISTSQAGPSQKRSRRT